MAEQQPGVQQQQQQQVAVAAPIIVNNRQANIFDYGKPTRFSGGPKRASFKDPLDPRNHRYDFGNKRILNQNPNAAIFTSANDSRTIQNRSYGNALSVYDKPTSNELNVKPITTTTEVIKNSSVQTKSKVLNDVFFLNYQKRKENNNIVKQPISLIPQKKKFDKYK